MRETSKALHAKNHYIELGATRSIRLAYLEHAQKCLGITKESDLAQLPEPRRWAEWSRVHGWVEQAKQWDEEAALRRREQRAKQLDLTLDQQVALAQMLKSRVVSRLTQMVATDQPIPENQLLSGLRLACDLELQGLGYIPTEYRRIEMEGLKKDDEYHVTLVLHDPNVLKDDEEDDMASNPEYMTDRLAPIPNPETSGETPLV